MKKENNTKKKKNLFFPFVISFLSCSIILLVGLSYLLNHPSTTQNMSTSSVNNSVPSKSSLKELYTEPLQMTFTLKQDDETTRYLRLTYSLSTYKEKDVLELEHLSSAVKGIFVQYFSDLTVNEVSGGDNFRKVSNELKKQLEEQIPVEIGNVYLTEFIIA